MKFIVILLWRCHWWRSPLRLQPDIWLMSGSKQPPRSAPAAGCPSLSVFSHWHTWLAKSRANVAAAALSHWLLTVWRETASCCAAEAAGKWHSSWLTTLPSPESLYLNRQPVKFWNIWSFFKYLFWENALGNSKQQQCSDWPLRTSKDANMMLYSLFVAFRWNQAEAETGACGIYEWMRHWMGIRILRRWSKSKQTRVYFKLSWKNVENSAGCVSQAQRRRRKLKKIYKKYLKVLPEFDKTGIQMTWDLWF